MSNCVGFSRAWMVGMSSKLTGDIRSEWRTAIRLLAMLAVVSSGGSPASSAENVGPRFRTDGYQAEAYGEKDAYPACTGLQYVLEIRCRVGAFSAFDSLFPARTIMTGSAASRLVRSEGEPQIKYTYARRERSLDQYLDDHPVTGFLIARGDTILVERYQYGRTDKHRLTSFSMAKTIIGLLIGIAVYDGAIRSITDHAEVYVPGLKDTEYGRTPIKSLLQMASGVFFSEEYANPSSDVGVLARLTLGQDQGGSVSALKRFNARYAPPGERFSYSSAESLVLGLVLAGATGRTVSDYASEKLWAPLGAEADATWNTDATGQEITFAYLNAVLRDYARLGLMLAHDGTWNGKVIVPREWVVASTTSEPGASSMGWYGYQVWLLPTRHRTFALRGLRGQFILVDPEARLVLVQTALASTGSGPEVLAHQELFALWSALSSQIP
jgi:CubicO group peptidase (beta-lactamase class C family)